MTHDEKLAITIDAIREARQFTRKDYYTKLHIGTGNGLSRIHIDQLHDILLQLQDDEKIITIKELPTALKPLTSQTSDMLDGKKNCFLIDILDGFDDWYASYLIQQKSQPENLDWLNLLKVLDICSDIGQQLQITRNTTVTIPSFPYPYIGRFLELFPYDSIGTRKSYQQHRWEGAQYLLRQGIATDIKTKTDDMLGYGNIAIKIDLVKFDDFYKAIKNEFEKRKKSFDKKDKKPKITTKIVRTAKEETVWLDDFRWEGKDFVFGKYGSINFISKNRKHIFKTLTDKKGGWATINELQGSKDAEYVRSTIKQIEDRLPKEAKEHIKIVSTQDDNSKEKPNQGAYRIKIKP